MTTIPDIFSTQFFIYHSFDALESKAGDPTSFTVLCAHVGICQRVLHIFVIFVAGNRRDNCLLTKEKKT